jgi:predicted nucleic acid-binding protein
MERVTSERFATAWELRKQFQDKPGISFTDLTSMAIIRDLGLSLVIFRVDVALRLGRKGRE